MVNKLTNNDWKRRRWQEKEQKRDMEEIATKKRLKIKWHYVKGFMHGTIFGMLLTYFYGLFGAWAFILIAPMAYYLSDLEEKIYK